MEEGKEEKGRRIKDEHPLIIYYFYAQWFHIYTINSSLQNMKQK